MLGVILGALLPVIVTLALGMVAGWRRDEDTVARLPVIPVLAFAAPTGIGQAGDLRKVTMLALGLAAAPMQVILSSRYKTDEKNASVLLYSNVLSIPSLAFLIWLTH